MNTLIGIKGDIEDSGYSNAFFTLSRENDSFDPWVLRTKQGAYIDSDYSRLDLAYRNNLELREI